jgi:hypothetical protein
MSIEVDFTATNGSSIGIFLEPADKGGSWTVFPSPFLLCSKNGTYSSSGIGWPSDLTLVDENGVVIIELFAFDPSSPPSSGNGALRCSTDAHFPQDTGSLGTPGKFTWKVWPSVNI